MCGNTFRDELLKMGQSDFLLPLDGGCCCGAIRCRVTDRPAFTFACHCTRAAN